MSEKTLYGQFCARAEEAPEAVAIISGAQQLTYNDVRRGIARLTAFLRDRGVGRGDRVLIFSENRPEFVMALFACSRVGAALTTVYPSFGPDEIAYIITHSEPALALVDPTQQEMLGNVMHGTASTAPVYDIVEASAFNEEVSGEDLSDPADAALICYTSGTTSRPKAVVHANGRLVRATEMHIRTWRITPQDRLLVLTPMAWLFGIATTTLAGLFSGASLVLFPHFNPVKAIQLIDTKDVTVTMGVGTMYAKMAEVAASSNRPASPTSLRLCLSGGEARNEGALASFREHFGTPVHDIYAASECFPIITSDPEVDPEPHPTASGRVVDGAEIRLVDGDGADVPPGEVGELIARSAASMLGYFRPENDLEPVVDAEGWFHTKDLARIDDEGLIHIVGRASDMIIRGGANISPAEVERVLLLHPAISEAAVAGFPDEVYGQRVVAFVIRAEDSLSESEVLRHAAEHLAKYKVPAQIEFVSDLPRTSNGKVKRSALVHQ